MKCQVYAVLNNSTLQLLACPHVLECLEAPVGEHAVVAQCDAKDTWDGIHQVANQGIAPCEGPAWYSVAKRRT
jgi:hypothetical protein